MKDKYETNIVKCIENELFPVMDDKISKKLVSLMDKKHTNLQQKFVEQREFEFKLETINQQMELVTDS